MPYPRSLGYFPTKDASTGCMGKGVHPALTAAAHGPISLMIALGTTIRARTCPAHANWGYLDSPIRVREELERI